MSDLGEFLKKVAIFEGLSDKDIWALLPDIKTYECKAEICVVKEGEPGHNLFIVKEGQLEIRKGNKAIASLTVGDVCGELSIIDTHPRSASAYAVKDTTLLTLNYHWFVELAKRDAKVYVNILLNIAKILAVRLRHANDYISNL